MEEEIIIILDPKKVQVKSGNRKFTVKSTDALTPELASQYANMGIYALQNQAYAAQANQLQGASAGGTSSGG